MNYENTLKSSGWWCFMPPSSHQLARLLPPPSPFSFRKLCFMTSLPRPPARLRPPPPPFSLGMINHAPKKNGGSLPLFDTYVRVNGRSLLLLNHTGYFIN